MPFRISKLSLFCLIILAAILLSGAAALKWKALQFTNPGTRRLLKTSAGNYYYYRSLPEKNLSLGVKENSTLEVRAISKSKIDKPQFAFTYAGKKLTYDLKVASVSISYHVFEPVRIILPRGANKADITCYNSDIYFRVYELIPPKTRKPPVPSLMIIKKTGQYKLTGTLNSSTYYGFDKINSLEFQVNKNRQFTLYAKAEVADKNAPVFSIYRDGVFLQQVVLSTKQTSSYKTEGINHLTIGKKIVFAPLDKVATYELRPLTAHRFLAKPVINKKK